MLISDENLLVSKLKALPVRLQLMFGLLLLERMAKPFLKFCHAVGFETVRYAECIETLWNYAKAKTSDSAVAISAEKLDTPPDTEDFDHPLTSAALNAVLVVRELADFVHTNDIEGLANCSTLACDTVALFVQAGGGTAPFSMAAESIANNPLMIQELQCQEDDLEYLTRHREEDSEKFGILVSNLRAQAQSIIPV